MHGRRKSLLFDPLRAFATFYTNESDITAGNSNEESRRSQASRNMSGGPISSLLGLATTYSDEEEESTDLPGDKASEVSAYNIDGWPQSHQQHSHYTNESISNDQAASVTLISRKYWQDDHSCTNCAECGESFTILRRKHHCRVCGSILCSNCSSPMDWKYGFIDSTTGDCIRSPVRACNRCREMIEREGIRLEGELHTEERIISLSPDTRRDDFINNNFCMPENSRPPAHGPKLSVVPTHIEKNGDEVITAPYYSISISSQSDFEESYNEEFQNSYKSPYSNGRHVSPAGDISRNYNDCPSVQDTYIKRQYLDKVQTSALTDEPRESPVESIGGPSDGKGTIYDPLIFRMRTRSLPINKRNSSNEIGPGVGNQRSDMLRRSRSLRRNFADFQIDVSNKSSQNAVKKEGRSRSSSNLSRVYQTHAFAPLEINDVNVEFVEKLVHQLITDSKYYCNPNWEKILMPMIRQVAETLQPELQDDSDIKIEKFFKVKCLEGATIDKSYVYSGVVFTRKLALKSMKSTFTNPRIMIISFSLNGYKNQSKFMSLEPIISQEENYVNGLVHRISLFNPHVLLLLQTASQRTLTLLAKKGIAVIQGLKPSTIDLVSRYTQAEIIHSIDKLALNPKIGYCRSLNVRKVPDSSSSLGFKSYVFFSGGRNELASTIVLQAPQKTELKKTKMISYIATTILYSLKLETYLVRDHFALCPTGEGLKNTLSLVPNINEFLTNLPMENFYERIHTWSPLVKMTLPDDVLKAIKISSDLQKLIEKSSVDLQGAEMVALPKVREMIYEADVKELTSSCQQARKQAQNFLDLNRSFIEDYVTKSIPVLFFLVNNKTFIPCEGPQKIGMEFFQEYDCCLGQFIEEMFTSSEKPCSASFCSRPLSEHYRSYVHGNSRISILIEDFSCPISGMEEIILMWSYCKLCKVNTPVLTMSDSTWRYSFARYLELFFYCDQLKCRAGLCPHNIFRDHVRYFGIKNKAIRMHWDAIEVYGLEIPSIFMKWNVGQALKTRYQEYKAICSKVKEFYQSVIACLEHIGQEFSTCSEKEDEFQKSKNYYILDAKESQNAILKDIEDCLMKNDDMKLTAFNHYYVQLQERIYFWEMRLLQFSEDFILPALQKKQKPVSSIRKSTLEKDQEQATNDNIAENRKYATFADEKTSKMQTNGSPRSKSGKVSRSNIRYDTISSLNSSTNFQIFDKTGNLVSFDSEDESYFQEDTQKVEECQNKSELMSGKIGNIQGAHISNSSMTDPVMQSPENQRFSSAFFPFNGNDDGEKPTSFFKIFTALFTEKQDLNNQIFSNPLQPTEHIFADSDIILREEEPSSIIALTLGLTDYKQKMSKILKDALTDTNVESKLESLLFKPIGTHFLYHLGEEDLKVSCKIFFAEQFYSLREGCKIEEHYTESLSRCSLYKFSGGKSGSIFWKTLDDRLTLKQISRQEMDAFLSFAPTYFKYMTQAIFHNLPTVLAKILGFYQINRRTANQTSRLNVIVMENLFYNSVPNKIFDLKGSMRNRHIMSTGSETEVLLDENLVDVMFENPLFIREHEKRLLQASLWNDTLFLSKVDVMDYSLVVGVNQANKTLKIGIIDFIRTYTWNKKLESWVKVRGFVGVTAKEPTIISPKLYKNRFREAMDFYFYGTPNCWHQCLVPLESDIDRFSNKLSTRYERRETHINDNKKDSPQSTDRDDSVQAGNQ